MAHTYRSYSTRRTPQSEPIPGKAMVPNEAGGYAFAVDDWARLTRFLIIGSEGTYYTDAPTLTRENAEVVLRLLGADGLRVVNEIVAVSDAGRAPKNDPALFALAMASALGDEDTRRAAYAALPKVARIGTHLLHFVAYREQFKGWSRGLRTAVGQWYTSKSADDLAFQLVKYAQRDGWSHADLLRLAHPNGKGAGAAHDALFRYAVDGYAAANGEALPALVHAAEAVKTAQDAKDAAKIIAEHRLPREAVPTRFLNDAGVWEALLAHMPMTATIRNLGKMTAVGLIAKGSDAARKVVESVTDAGKLRKARVHPMALLVAQKVYELGHGDKGSLQWTPVPSVVDALDVGFYSAFGNVEPTGQARLEAIDASGSMDCPMAGCGSLTCREAGVALALIAVHTEDNVEVMGFTCGDHAKGLPFSRRQRLTDAMRLMNAMIVPDGTDCALPFTWAMANKVNAHAVSLYSDNNTWAGIAMHPVQALAEYRNSVGRVKFAVVSMTANRATVGDPDDVDTLQVVGFDTATPQLVADFVAGRL